MQKARAKHSRLLKLMVTILTGCLLCCGRSNNDVPSSPTGHLGSKRKPFELRRKTRKDSTIAMGDRRLQVAGHLLWCESALYLQRLKLQSLSCAYRIWETPSKNKHSVLQLLEPHALPPT